MPMMRRMLQLHEEGALDENQESWFVWPRPREEFYDLEKDPHEICNLINDPAYRKDINRLRKVYRQWERKYWQCRPLTEPEIVQTMWPDGVQPLVSAPQIVRNGEKHWNLYVEPFVVHKGDRVAVQAFRVGYKKSEIVDFLIEH